MYLCYLMFSIIAAYLLHIFSYSLLSKQKTPSLQLAQMEISLLISDYKQFFYQTHAHLQFLKHIFRDFLSDIFSWMKISSKCNPAQWLIIAGRKSEEKLSTTGVTQGNLGLPKNSSSRSWWNKNVLDGKNWKINKRADVYKALKNMQ